MHGRTRQRNSLRPTVKESRYFEEKQSGSIIENNGCAVKDAAIRSGRRARRSNDQGDCKNKIIKRQRKATIAGRPVHPDCEDAQELLLSKGQSHLDKLLQESILVDDDSGDEST